MHTISRRLNEMNLNITVASKFLKVTKRANLDLPLNTSYQLKNNEIVFTSGMRQSLTSSVVTGEGLFDAVLRNDIRLSAAKAALNLEEDVWWCLAWL